jgi:hypothetical protein
MIVNNCLNMELITNFINKPYIYFEGIENHG